MQSGNLPNTPHIPEKHVNSSSPHFKYASRGGKYVNIVSRKYLDSYTILLFPNKMMRYEQSFSICIKY